ncbi:hypothetical protein CCACVL1_26836 [Corchorus capsularis]|uniref:Uncharacterized protein n=1 Tax=Corchorus capsularis TaxID=210143 RepID=A0A1R3GD08_COCAP|nr:hypothetical protein CCACVL1_26836 [Corchorus capsularis]
MADIAMLVAEEYERRVLGRRDQPLLGVTNAAGEGPDKDYDFEE